MTTYLNSRNVLLIPIVRTLWDLEDFDKNEQLQRMEASELGNPLSCHKFVGPVGTHEMLAMVSFLMIRACVTLMSTVFESEDTRRALTIAVRNIVDCNSVNLYNHIHTSQKNVKGHRAESIVQHKYAHFPSTPER